MYFSVQDPNMAPTIDTQGAARSASMPVAQGGTTSTAGPQGGASSTTGAQGSVTSTEAKRSKKASHKNNCKQQ